MNGIYLVIASLTDFRLDSLTFFLIIHSISELLSFSLAQDNKKNEAMKGKNE